MSAGVDRATRVVVQGLTGRQATWFSQDTTAYGTRLVDLEIWGENQRNEVTTKGIATVLLPSRDTAAGVTMDGSQVGFQLPQVR